MTPSFITIETIGDGGKLYRKTVNTATIDSFGPEPVHVLDYGTLDGTKIIWTDRNRAHSRLPVPPAVLEAALAATDLSAMISPPRPRHGRSVAL